MLVYLAKKPSNDPGLRSYTWYMRLLVTLRGTRVCPDYFAELEHGSQLAPLH